jgi:hypothetical protein
LSIRFGVGMNVTLCVSAQRCSRVRVARFYSNDYRPKPGTYIDSFAWIISES